MSTIGPVSGNANSQWQLLQQLKASHATAASSAGGKAVSGAVPDPGAVSSPAASPLASTGTAGSSTPFDAVAAKLLSGLQSFLVNLQSGGGDAAQASPAMSSATGASAGATPLGDAGTQAAQLPTSVTQMMRSYSQQAANSADASLMASLQV